MVREFYVGNDTMKVLGAQIVGDYITEDFRNVVRAHGNNEEVFDIGLDFFALGIIYGKKLERAKRRRKANIELISTPVKKEVLE